MRKHIAIFIFCILFSLPGFSIQLSNQNNSISDKECLAFAKAIEDSLNLNKTNILFYALDSAEFLRRVKNVEDRPLKVVEMIERDNISMGYIRGIFVSTIVESGNGGLFNHCKLYRNNNVPHIIFRIMNGEGSFRYFDFEIFKVGHKLMIADVYSPLEGSHFSKMIRSEILYSLYSKEKGEFPITELSEKWQADVKIKRAQILKDFKDFTSAKELFYSVPEKYRQDKECKMLEIMILSHVNENEPFKFFETFKRDPLDPGQNVFFFDWCGYIGKYDIALECLSGLEKNYGPDPAIDFAKGKLNLTMGNFDVAQQHFQNALKTLPNFKLVHASLFAISLEKKDYKKASELGIKLVNEFGYNASELDDFILLSHDDFMQSEEYKKWKEAIKK